MSVWLERGDLPTYGIPLESVESETGRRVCWIEHYYGLASNDDPAIPKSPPYRGVLVGLHIYFCNPSPDDKCESCGHTKVK